MTPMTRGSFKGKRRRHGFESRTVLPRNVSLVVKTQRNGGFEVHPTMGRHIEAYY
jgi:hypothetical protein